MSLGKEFYRNYYIEKGIHRNSLLGNPEVVFQVLASDAGFYQALGLLRPDPLRNRVLDVGCGDGASLNDFLRVGFRSQNLYGIDFQEERIIEGKRKYPSLKLFWGDATALAFDRESFDLVFESTMFIHSVNDDVSEKIAAEMVRVTKVGGHLLLRDWRYARRGSPVHKALSQSRIEKLFRIDRETRLCASYPGSLIPPVGRFLSRYIPSIYFAVRAALPFLVGQRITILQKLK